MQNNRTRFVLIGGFLGAGKTTLISRLASKYIEAGLRVGIITNDQADNLVDTQNLRSQGFEVGEVAGACFCCSFNDLIETADRFSGDEAPDVLLAEPVGSCTDLVATVILPLQQLLGDRFELAPFGVLLKPSHGRRILSSDADNRSGFSPQAEYIFRKQLEEADYIMVGRRDQLTVEQADELSALISEASDHDVPVLSVSPMTGEGIDEVLGYIESPMAAGRRILEIDYDTYADGEAELGWVNLSAMLDAPTSVSLDDLASKSVANIAAKVISQDGQIAHLKISVLAGDTQAVANVVSNDLGVDVGLSAGRDCSGTIQLLVNARVAMDPSELESICRHEVDQIAEQLDLVVNSVEGQSLRPGRPVPTHRVSAD